MNVNCVFYGSADTLQMKLEYQISYQLQMNNHSSIKTYICLVKTQNWFDAFLTSKCFDIWHFLISYIMKCDGDYSCIIVCNLLKNVDPNQKVEHEY